MRVSAEVHGRAHVCLYVRARMRMVTCGFSEAAESSDFPEQKKLRRISATRRGIFIVNAFFAMKIYFFSCGFSVFCSEPFTAF